MALLNERKDQNHRMSDRGTLDNLQTCDDVEALLPLFALGALDADEAAAVAAHLPICPACSAQLVHFEAVTGLLGTALEPVTPSAGSRASLLERAATTPRETEYPVTAPSPAPAPVVSLAERRQSSLRSWAMAAAAVLVIGLGGLGFWINDLMNERDEAMTSASTLADFVAPDATAMPMTAMPASRYTYGDGVGMMMKDHDGEMIVVVEGCPPSSDERIYKVWVGEGENRVMLGDMKIAEDGSGWMPVTMPDDMPAPEILGVSVIDGSSPLTDLFIGEMPA